MNKAFADPNIAQRRASHPGKSVWVGASAGTGKTKVLTDRVLRLLLPQAHRNPASGGLFHTEGTEPHRLLCLTFTKAAASEMMLRIQKRLSFWAVCSDEVLEKELTELLGISPDHVVSSAARELFAKVVDTPDGLKIMTIHSFCQSVLSRFPLEAGLPPYFTVEDEAKTSLLLHQARDSVFQRAKLLSDQDISLASAIHRIAELQNEDQFAKTLDGILSERLKLWRLPQSRDDMEALLYQQFGLSRDVSKDSLLDHFFQETQSKKTELMAAASALQTGSKVDLEKGSELSLWLKLPIEEQKSRFDRYRELFLLKNENTIRATLITKKTALNYPHIPDVLQAEAERVLHYVEQKIALSLISYTLDLIEIAQEIFKEYQRLKHCHAVLDYDDQILKTLELLQTEGISPWIMYKLDGGLDHILVDEAQDTNPEQWQIIQRLSEEFFTAPPPIDDEYDGNRLPERQRTVFVVGDEKQSIYSFQRASPEEFERMRGDFRQKIHPSVWHEEKLNLSFRSVPSVLTLVDEVFRPPHIRQGLGLENVEHQSFRHKQAGLCEIWPLVPREKEDQKENNHDGVTELTWQLPLTEGHASSPQAQLADKIASQIKIWLEQSEILESEGRPLHPGDIMVLVKTRTAFVGQLMRALKLRNIPVSGLDRMILGDQLVIQDLIAAASFALLPEDNLTLSSFLKSPLIGLTDDDLAHIAIGRQGQSIWDSLQNNQDFQDVTAYCRALIKAAKMQSPYVFFNHILQKPPVRSTGSMTIDVGIHSGLQAFISRLGEDIKDSVQEFLNLALEYERRSLPSLQGFLFWQARHSQEIKREQEEAGHAVRIMTIHGSKGLQAPIVFLPDTIHTQQGKRVPRTVWVQENATILPLWSPNSDIEPEHFKEQCAALEDRLDEEYRRLLYVAMTRAEDRLYICGAEKERALKSSWYQMIDEAFDRLEQSCGEDGIKRITNPQLEDPRKDQKPKNQVHEGYDDLLPDVLEFLTQKAPKEQAPPKVLRPSRDYDQEGQSRDDSALSALSSPLKQNEQNIFIRGQLTHKLLEVLSNYPEPDRLVIAARYLDTQSQAISQALKTSIIEETLKILTLPEAQFLFGAESQAEVPVTGYKNGQIISGQIDRLALDHNGKTIWIADFKTNRPPPKDPKNIPVIYKRQMQAYKDVLEDTYPGYKIRCFLLWTDGPNLIEMI